MTGTWLALAALVASAAPTLDLTLEKTWHGANAPKSVSVSPTGKYAVVANLEGMDFWVFDARTLEKLQEVKFHPTPGMTVDYKGDQVTLKVKSLAEKPVETAFTGQDRYLWLSLHNGACIVRYDLENGPLEGFTGKTARATVKDLRAGKSWEVELPQVPTGTTPKIIVPTAGDRYLLVSSWSGARVTVVDPRKLAPVADIPMPSRGYIPRGIAASPDGRFAYVGNMRGGTITKLDLEAMKVVADWPISPNPTHVNVTRDGKWLYVPDNKGHTMIKVDAETGKTVQRADLKAAIYKAVLDPDERYLYSGFYFTGKLAVVDVPTFKVVKEIPFDRPMGIAVSPDNQRLWVTSHNGGYVKVYRIGAPAPSAAEGGATRL